MDVAPYAYICEVRADYSGPRLDMCLDVSQMIGHTAESFEPFAKACRSLGGEVVDHDQLASYIRLASLRLRVNTDMRLILLRSDDPLTLDDIQRLLTYWAQKGVIEERLRQYAWFKQGVHDEQTHRAE